MKRHLGFCLLAGLLIPTPGKAQVTVSSATFICQQAAAKAVEKFVDKTAKAIEACLLGVTKCNLQTGPANSTCVAQLLAPNSGKCAVGKLGPAGEYYGPSAPFVAANPDKSAIAKALVAFVKGLGNCAPGIGVDYSALQFSNTSPADVLDVADSLNTIPDGAACLAHKRVQRTFPAAITLFNQLGNHPDGANMPAGVFAFLIPANPCK